jgi:hypothetical protein
MRHVTTLSVWSHDSGASGWVAEVDGGRITLLISPQPYRGFSGEGQLLTALSGSRDSADAAGVLEHLAWEPLIDPTWITLETSLDERRVTTALAELEPPGRSATTSATRRSSTARSRSTPTPSNAITLDCVQTPAGCRRVGDP